MNLEKFLDLRSLKSVPAAESALERLRQVHAANIDGAHGRLKCGLQRILQRWPESRPLTRKIEQLLADVRDLPDCVYRRTAALLNLSRNRRIPLNFAPAVEQLLRQEPAGDAPEQATLLSILERLLTLWNSLVEAKHFREDEQAEFAEKALLTLRVLHPGANAMNADYVPGRRAAGSPLERRRIRMHSEGVFSDTAIELLPTDGESLIVRCPGQDVLLDPLRPTAVIGRPLVLSTLFRLEMLDEHEQSLPLLFPIEVPILHDDMYSRAAIRVALVPEPDGRSSVFITENGAFFEIDLQDRLYNPHPDAGSGLCGSTRFLRLSPFPGQPPQVVEDDDPPAPSPSGDTSIDLGSSIRLHSPDPSLEPLPDPPIELPPILPLKSALDSLDDSDPPSVDSSTSDVQKSSFDGSSPSPPADDAPLSSPDDDPSSGSDESTTWNRPPKTD